MKQALNVESILLNEVDNEKYVYLYLEGDNWCAYERSAYYLAKEFPVVLNKEIVHDGYEVILMKASFNIDKAASPVPLRSPEKSRGRPGSFPDPRPHRRFCGVESGPNSTGCRPNCRPALPSGSWMHSRS